MHRCAPAVHHQCKQAAIVHVPPTLPSTSLERSGGRMTIWEGQLPVTNPLDTFLSLPGWHKGIAFINGFNLGRYW